MSNLIKSMAYLGLVAIAACSKSVDQCLEVIPPSDGRPSILVIGDSISIGWLGALKNSGALSKYQVVHNPCNARFSAYTMARVQSWLEARPQWYAVIYNNGLWDVADFVGETYSGYQSNETVITNRINGATSRPLFLLTTGVPINTPYRLDAHVAQFNALIQPAIESLGVPVLDLYGPSHSAPIVNEHSGDGIVGDVHYTAQGYTDISNLVLNKLAIQYGIH